MNVSDTDCQAWKDLFDSTHGENWKSCSKDRLDPCSCDRVSCAPNNDSTKMSIESLVLQNRNLKGTLPPTLANLQYLVQFTVNGNSLSGFLPDLPWTRFTRNTCILVDEQSDTCEDENKFDCPLPAQAIAHCSKSNKNGNLEHITSQDCHGTGCVLCATGQYNCTSGTTCHSKWGSSSTCANYPGIKNECYCCQPPPKTTLMTQIVT